MKVRLFIFTGVLFATLAKAQVAQENQLWTGIITQTKLNAKYSLWVDSHFVPKTFILIRTGITRETSIGKLTGGIAFVKLADGERNLIRNEWRPWFQWMNQSKLSPKFQLNYRFRYETRFKQSLIEGHPEPHQYDANHRLRVQLIAKTKLYSIHDLNFHHNLGGEWLYSIEHKNRFMDQTRLHTTLGFGTEKWSVQSGYMIRHQFNETHEKTGIFHTWINWLFITI